MIKRIKVDNLWGERSVDWCPSRQVNVLSGTNGTGKSTILRSVYSLFSNGSLSEQYLQLFDSLEVELEDGSMYSSAVPFDPDSVQGNVLSNLCSWDSYSTADTLSFTADEKFCDIIDDYLKLTRKTIVRNTSEVQFSLPSGKTISFPMLSSGEKELLKIMVLASFATQQDVIILDEPENSLHFDWQKNLVSSILELSSGAQIILSTHSPAIIMNGWVANVDNIDRITAYL